MKLSPLTIYIVGLFMALTILSYGLFQHWIPNNQEKDQNEIVLQQIRDQVALTKKAESRKAEAIAMVKASAASWSAIAETKTPLEGVEKGGISLATDAWDLMGDTRKFRNSIQRAVNQQLKTGGVKVVNGPFVPDIDVNAPANSILASYYNYPAIPFPVVIFDLGTVTVQGTHKQIFDNVKGWTRMPHYLAVADGLALTGTSPNITGTYNLTLVGFIRGKTIYPAVSEGAAAAGGATGFGGASFGGPPGGIPGGPGGSTGGPSAAKNSAGG